MIAAKEIYLEARRSAASLLLWTQRTEQQVESAIAAR